MLLVGARPSAASAGPRVEGRATSGPGQPLDAATRAAMEPRFGHDFSAVRVHADAGAARHTEMRGAEAVTLGSDIGFAAGRYAPGTPEGRELIAHELAHVVQQSGAGGAAQGGDTLEAQAQEAGARAMRGGDMPALDTAPRTEQRRIPLRDGGRGLGSGMSHIDQLIARLNAMSTGLDFAVVAGALDATLRPRGTLSEFDRQMKAFVDDATPIPMRMVTRHNRLGNRLTGFRETIDVDNWRDGYVDIDDLLASSDLGLQIALVHFLRERQATRRYDARIGTPSMDPNFAGPAAEFNGVHGAGLQRELLVLRDFFSDPSIVVLDADSRRFRNDRGHRINMRTRIGRGVESGIFAVNFEVVIPGPPRRVMTAEAYRDMRRAEATAAQIEGERLRGATEHREGGRSVPAP
jgi:Domain of unknown function (DUF4157)